MICQVLARDDSDEPKSLCYDDLVKLKRRDLLLDAGIIVAVDVEDGHCHDVIASIVAGFNHAKPRPDAQRPGIVGFTASAPTGRFVDVFSFSERLLRMAEFVGPKYGEKIAVRAINMSVDFGQILPGYYEELSTGADYPCAIASIPVLDRIFEIVTENLAQETELSEKTRNGRPFVTRAEGPALFAAAGNRSQYGGYAHVRLGYPAIRPETFAVTFVESDSTSGFRIADAVEAPATSVLKPCFAVPVNQASGSRTDGSSFACAWAAGYYAALNANSISKLAKLGPMSRIAWLMRRSARCSLSLNELSDLLPSHVEVLRQDGIDSEREQAAEGHATGLAGELLGTLERRFHADICLYGSMATVNEWLRLHGKTFASIHPDFLKDLGDIDLIYTRGLGTEARECVNDSARRWLQGQIKRAWILDRKRPVELHAVSGLIGVAERLRSVTPCTKIIITGAGLIDVWGGLKDLELGQIRFNLMTNSALWEANKLYSTGADSFALNVLQWLSCILLLRLIALGAGVADNPVNFVKPEASSLEKVANVISTARAGRPGTCFALFGGERGDSRERLERRFERVETLLGSCERHNIASDDLEPLLGRLRALQRERRFRAS